MNLYASIPEEAKQGLNRLTQEGAQASKDLEQAKTSMAIFNLQAEANAARGAAYQVQLEASSAQSKFQDARSKIDQAKFFNQPASANSGKPVIGRTALLIRHAHAVAGWTRLSAIPRTPAPVGNGSESGAPWRMEAGR